ncbi:MAG: glycoside hydrolase family 127 protein, partial [Phycisphaerae bacterium]|nr:glycoside hydrolase family 127 protein [Phycisphaerae bacterium]
MLGCADVSNGAGPKDKLKTIKPVPFTAVHLDDAFWAPRIETNRSATIPYAFGKCEETGRVENFVRAAKKLRGQTLQDDRVRGYSFDDTDIYKILEGASFGLSVKADPEMEKYLDGLIAKVAAAQEPDGYLYTARTINPEKPHGWAGKKRWEKVHLLSHELYNMGHFYEAAVAHYQ